MWTLAGLVMTIIPVLTWVSVGHAQRFSPVISEDQVVHGSIYTVDKSVDIRGEVYGDIICAGQDIKIDAKVHGDVMCAGMNMTVKGEVDGDVRLTGQLVDVAAKVAGSATAAAAKFSLDADASVGRDLAATGSDINIKGSVGRDVTGGGSRVTVNADIGRNIAVQTGSLVLKDDAKVGGAVTYTSVNKLTQSQKAKVAGDIKQKQPAKQGYSFDPLWFLFMAVGLTLVVMALAFLFPRFMDRQGERMRQQFGGTLFVGLVTIVLAPIVCIGLTVAVVGIPLLVVAGVALLFGILLSGPLTAYFVGQLLLKNNQAPVLVAATGSAVVIVLYFLPIFGFVFVVFAAILGLGALVLELQRQIKIGGRTPPAKHQKEEEVRS